MKKTADTRDFYRSLGKRIRQLRKARCLSQEQLAKAIGVSRPALCNIEAGRQQLYLHLVAPLATAIGVTIEELTAENCRVLEPRPIDKVQIPAVLVSDALKCATKAEDVLGELRTHLAAIRRVHMLRWKTGKRDALPDSGNLPNSTVPSGARPGVK